MKKRIFSLLLALVLVAGMMPLTLGAAADETPDIYLVEDDGTQQPVQGVSLAQNGAVKLCVRADTACWQIEYADEQWVDIQGASSPTLRVSYGMVAGLLSGGCVRMRCVADERVSEPVTIEVTEPEPQTGVAEPGEAPEPLPAPVATQTEPADEDDVPEDDVPEDEYAVAPLSLGEGDVPEDDEESAAPQGTPTTVTGGKTYTITIRYLYSDSSQYSGQNVALPYIEQRAAGWTGSVSVTSPNCIGYTPDQTQYTAEITSLDEDKVFTVYYSPAVVSYSVRHYQQNVENDEYTLVDTTRVSGYTEALTSNKAAAQEYPGFTALNHYSDKIAADGSTAVDIYYDRNYYMLSFDLGGGYGVEPIYARYGAAVSVAEPTKAGYVFSGWSPALASTMPIGGGSYTATWTANEGVKFTVVYWLEDANEAGNYHYWTDVEQTARAGSTVKGESYKEIPEDAKTDLDVYELRYSEFAEADESVTVAGDGSTVLNVYYDRKEYTLKFYYAARDTQGTTDAEDDIYKVVGGTTYPFGKYYNDSVASNGASALLKHMYEYDKGSQWGQITGEPKLKAGIEYDTGADTVDGLSNVEFMYISFKARYGQDISELWPCDVFNEATRTSKNTHEKWSGMTAYVSAWNGEHHVYYSQNESNQTIKGKYSQLDYKLLFDSQFEDSSTVCYLCFWENGADISWSVPKLFCYRVWLPLTDGGVPEGYEDAETKEYGGVTYYLYEKYDTCDDSTFEAQTQPSINGYSANGKQQEELTEFDKDKYQEACLVNFYYKANTYTLTFFNGDNQLGQTSMSYGQNVWSHYAEKVAPQLQYYDANLKDIYTFDAWYTTPSFIEGTQFELNQSTTMPSNNGTLYAHWVPVTRTVEVYKTEAGTDKIGGDISVPNNTLVPESARPAEPTNGSNEFIGWFYRDSSGVEHAFSFAATPVTRDLKVYAKWRSTETRVVTVRYILEKDGAEIEVARSETQRLTVGQVRTYNAKTGSALYEAYQSGCFPTVASQSITPTGAEGEDLTVTFRYVQYEAVPYKVHFVIEDDNGVQRPAYRVTNDGVQFAESWSDTYTEYVEEHNDNNKSVVTELYAPDDPYPATLPDGYVPNALQTTLVVVPGEENEYNEANTIVFVYKHKEGVARYSVEHYIQTPDGTDYTLYQHTEGEGSVGAQVSAQPITISGYEYSHDATDERKDNNTLTTEDETDTLSGRIARDHSLTLKLYYNAIEYPYQVMYLEKDTGVVLAATKTTEDGNPLKGRYGSTVTESALEIDHYKVDAGSKSLVIAQEAKNADGGYTASQNTIYFYYTPISGRLQISKTVALDPEQEKEEGIAELPPSALEQEFTFTVTAHEGFHKSSYDYVITKANGDTESGSELVHDGVLTVTLHHGESIVISELRLDTYTVTETFVPGFLAVTDGTTMGVSARATLEREGETVSVNYENRYPFYTGELVVRKQVNKLAPADPDATGNYTVKITLRPDQSAREVDRTVTWTDADGSARSLVIPEWVEDSENNQSEFELTVTVPAGTSGKPGEVKLQGVPVGEFIAEEQANVDAITAYYDVHYDYALHQNDEKTDENGASASGHIHGGHPTAVTFKNTYKKGSLTIEKTVEQEYEYDSFQRGTFTFTVEGHSELPAGEYTLGDGQTATVDASGKVTLPAQTITVTKENMTNSLTLTNLPAGQYTVTEGAAAGYTVTEKPESALYVGGTTAATAHFTNRFNRTTGKLTVGKEIKLTENAESGVTIDTEREFEFTLVPLDGADLTKLSVGAFTVADNKLSFKLKHNESITIDDLPVGKYELRETAAEKYGSNFDAAPNAGTYTKKAVEIKTDQETTVSCENTFPVDTATLVVRKTVASADDNAVNAAPPGDSFTFRVALSGYDESITLSQFVQSSFSGEGNDSRLVFDNTNGTITFVLKNNESMSLTLPVCAFTVEETGMSSSVNTDNDLAEHYDVSYTVEKEAGVPGKTYYLDNGKTVTAAFTNTYKRHYADLTIETKAEYKDQNFIFDVVSEDKSIRLQVILEDNDSRTIKDLPVGKYTVTERNDWSWREDVVPAQTADLTTGSKTVTFAYNAAERTEWLSGYSYGIGKGG